MSARLIRSLVDRAARRVASHVPGPVTPAPLNKAGDSYDVAEIAWLRASLDSARYYERHMLSARAFPNSDELLRFAVDLSPKDGALLEFGVATGHTLSVIAGAAHPRQVVGFDSFEGLPETWRAEYREGAFAMTPPDVPKNAELKIGYFSETLPDFSASMQDNIAFLHVDCDLYSSTKCIFDYLGHRIRTGTVIVFNEYFNYPGWREHEYLAFREWVKKNQIGYTYAALVPSHQQVCVVIG